MSRQLLLPGFLLPSSGGHTRAVAPRARGEGVPVNWFNHPNGELYASGCEPCTILLDGGAGRVYGLTGRVRYGRVGRGERIEFLPEAGASWVVVNVESSVRSCRPPKGGLSGSKKVLTSSAKRASVSPRGSESSTRTSRSLKTRTRRGSKER